MEQHVEWTTPAPLWNRSFDPSDSSSRRRFRQPAILRFDTDTFMDEYLATLNQDPGRLQQLVASYETWRRPSAAPSALAPPQGGLAGKFARLRTAAQRKLEARTGALTTVAPAAKPLKLFQPAHARFYLVTGCLVCRMPGLPDRHLETSQAERVSFVVRRLQLPKGADPINFDPATATELAFVGTPSGFQWQPVTGSAAQLWPGEEQLPLSPANYQDDNGRRRRLCTGLVPVGKREAYFGAATRAPQAGDFTDPRRTTIQNDVISPWQSLLDLATATNLIWVNQDAQPDQTHPEVLTSTFDAARLQIKTMSWYILLDFSHLLENLIQPVWEALTGTVAASLTDHQNALLKTLNDSRVTYANATTKSLASALVDIRQFDADLELQNTRFVAGAPNWPNFEFPLAAPYKTPLSISPVADTVVLKLSIEGKASPTLDDLNNQLATSLPDPGTAALGPPKTVAVTAANGKNAQGADLFWVRFIFERPACGPLAPPLVSEPTTAFQLAAFFDPDAPARSIRIAMPVDTSPAGLRKFDKNTAFVMSDTLCGQVKATSGLSLGDLVLSVLPFPFHKGLDGGADGTPCPGGGLVCSMSIPIITICAMILLMIIVKLFDIIFFWMLFFRICLPIPDLKAKEIQ